MCLGFPIEASSDVSRRTPDQEQAAARHLGQLTNAQKLLQADVLVEFSDAPAMANVVACESDFRQFGPDGKPLISSTDDVGVAQVNIPSWGKEAKSLGLDIYNSPQDNLTMARIILDQQGITAWSCYKKTHMK